MSTRFKTEDPAVGNERLCHLAKHIRGPQRGLTHFNFAVTCSNVSPHENPPKANSCGTNGCAIGELPYAFPEFWAYKLFPEELLSGLFQIPYTKGTGQVPDRVCFRFGDSDFRVPLRHMLYRVADFFCLEFSQVEKLFIPGDGGEPDGVRPDDFDYPLPPSADAETVALRLELFVQKRISDAVLGAGI